MSDLKLTHFLCVAARLTVPMCRHVPAHADICADTCRCRHVPTLVILIIWTAFISKLGCAGKCQHPKRCRHMGRCRHVPTHQGADTCRHLWYSSYGLFYLQTGMCWHVSAPEKGLTPGKVPTRAETSWCRHVPLPVMPIIWTLLGCWNLLICVRTWKIADTWAGADTCRHAPTHLGVDTCGTNHMDFFICKLGCAGMCQHLKRCRHLGRCRHVPTRLGAYTCRHLWWQTYELYLDAGIC